MPFDPTKPVNASPIVAAELRDQLNALKALIDNLQTQLNNVQALAEAKAPAPTVTPLVLTVHNPPTQADVVALRDFVNTLLAELQVAV